MSSQVPEQSGFSPKFPHVDILARDDAGAYNAWFECISGCGQNYFLRDMVYECEQCGGLLEVRHDLEKLKAKSPS